MPHTVVGLFKNTEAAQKVKQELINEGFATENIQVMANNTGATTTSSASVPNSEQGIGATISNFFRSFTGSGDDDQYYSQGVTSGGAIVAVTVADGQEDKAADLLESYGATNVDEQGTTAATTSNKATGTNLTGSIPGEQKLSVVEEELQVGKREVRRGGVRVYSHVTERPVTETVNLREEHVRVERRPVDRPVTDADLAAFKEGTIELTETAEEAVVSKQARVVEEVVVGKDVSQRQQTIKDTVRRTDVEVEQLGDDTEYRKHFATNYSSGGASYDQYAPAYQYGSTLANDPRYKSSRWEDVETSAKSDWASRGQGSWDDFKAAVRQGWDKVRGATTSTSR